MLSETESSSMSESARDEVHSGASSLQVDLSKLVNWAHAHGTICNQIPALEFIQDMEFLSNNNAVLWMCRFGHAYHWPCGSLNDRGEEEMEAVRRSKRLLSPESLAMESGFEEKRLKLAPSEMGQADSGSTGSSDRSRRVTEQKVDSAYTRNNKPEGCQNTRKPITSFSAAEQHFSMSGSRIQTGEQDMKSESDQDLLIISEQCEADEDNQGDRISQDNVSEPSTEELEVLPCQNMALDQPTASERAAFAPTARPPLSRAYILQTPVSDLEDPSRSILRLGPFTAAVPMAETSRAGSPPGSAASKVHSKPLPVPSTEARAQHESQPSVAFFELQATADVQQHLQLSPPECGTLGTGSSGDGAENVGEDSSSSGSGQIPCSSALQSPESHSPAAPNGDMKKTEKRKSYTIGDIKVFKEWLRLHHPSETRKIHALPPADLDHYLVSFFISAKRRNGVDFSANSLRFFQRNINLYLKDHNYQYNTLRGPEFSVSQEAYRLKYWYLYHQKEEMKEKGWSLVENLTDEDVEKLLKKGVLSKTHPQGLLHLMLTNLIRGFGVHTHHQAHELYWGQVVLKKTKGGVEYLEWKDDLSPGGNEGELRPQLFAKPEDPESCPVADYKQYARKRPPDMLNDNHPLYLSPKSLCSVWDKVWYSRKALTKAKIDKIMKVIIQDIIRAIRNTST
ncbi:uncharacterized protein KIAA1958 homolog [Hirundo rustica]|uniref:uncharacterized protein KIAA1958 homolog n=1 Tax=Hirundo rustica TaxID=43150 RepID=UPI001A93C456|nr:uncharacterized protein KIAA1958 homolog [Hirundo rustica]XP_039942665.1 uncharacterized protein KIAA1958 homolog [Hirundo rustica]